MRGDDEQSGHLFSYLSPEQRVTGDDPLRTVPRDSLSSGAVSKMMSPKLGSMQGIPGDERERGSIGNRLRIKPLCPAVARHHQLRNTRLQGSIPSQPILSSVQSDVRAGVDGGAPFHTP